MRPADSPARAKATASDPGPALYGAFWRWHFYAGLLVMPILMLMALTGGLYLFKDEIDGAVYRSLITVPPAAGHAAPQAWASAALQAVPGRVVQVAVPAGPGRSARLVVEGTDGSRRAVYVDPHAARVLGSTPDGGVMQVVKRLHSLDIAGPVLNLAVEVVAGWAIVMVATGVVLWWPRGQAGVVTVRGGPRRRLFWRDLHAVTGAFAGVVIVFLAATGMPWSAVWGQQVRRLTTEAGWGRPAAPAASQASGHAPGHQAEAAVPWALQDMALHAGHAEHGAASLTLDAALARIDAAGLPRPYVVAVPAEPGAAWSAAHTPDKVEKMRTLFLDGTDGRVIADIGYDRFGPAAKAIEWGIAVHQGTQFGPLNKAIMLTGCVAVWLLGISALVMWWKRRPKGRLGAPPRPLDRRGYAALAAVVVPLGVIYPLVGVSLVAALVIDLVVRRVMPAATPGLEGRS